MHTAEQQVHNGPQGFEACTIRPEQVAHTSEESGGWTPWSCLVEDLLVAYTSLAVTVHRNSATDI